MSDGEDERPSVRIAQRMNELEDEILELKRRVLTDDDREMLREVADFIGARHPSYPARLLRIARRGLSGGGS